MTNKPPGGGEPVRLTLYGRTYCHLCDDMAAALEAIRSESGPIRAFELSIVDVDADPALEARFDELVPVLMQDETEICHYFLDRAKLLEILRI